MNTMIKYGLKLWSNNIALFEEAVRAQKQGSFDFIELYSNSTAPDYAALRALRDIPVTIHAPHDGAFHEFVITETEETAWKHTRELADFFESPVIVLHPGRDHTLESFKKNLDRIDDSRICIENMAGLDVDHRPMFGQTITDLKELRELKPICFDFEKAIKAAAYQKLDYKEYIASALRELKPSYFHISGGDYKNAVDEHLDLIASNLDLTWIKHALTSLEGDAMLVFETPKRDGIMNDMRNMEYFRSL